MSSYLCHFEHQFVHAKLPKETGVCPLNSKAIVQKAISLRLSRGKVVTKCRKFERANHTSTIARSIGIFCNIYIGIFLIRYIFLDLNITAVVIIDIYVSTLCHRCVAELKKRIIKFILERNPTKKLLLLLKTVKTSRNGRVDKSNQNCIHLKTFLQIPPLLLDFKCSLSKGSSSLIFDRILQSKTDIFSYFARYIILLFCII